MVIAGCAAHTGLLSLPGVLLAGGLGVLASDWTCFLIGRSCRGALRRWLPGVYRRAEAAVTIVDAHAAWFILGFQFVPGTSTVTPIAIGMSHIPATRFLLLDLLGVSLWTLLFGLIGYVFGTALEQHIGDVRIYAVLVLLLALGVYWLRRGQTRFRSSDN